MSEETKKSITSEPFGDGVSARIVIVGGDSVKPHVFGEGIEEPEPDFDDDEDEDDDDDEDEDEEDDDEEDFDDDEEDDDDDDDEWDDDDVVSLARDFQLAN